MQEHHRGRNALIVLLVIAALGAGAFVLWQQGIVGSRLVTADELSRVLIVAASPDENGAVVGQVVMIADLTQSPAALEPVSPALAVTIPGTTFTTIADAYPFGGGAGTAEALAGAQGGEPLPYVAIGPEALDASVEASGGVVVTLPAAMSVFDGKDLYTFKKGEQTLSAAELGAVFKGAPYLTAGERKRLDRELARALAGVLAAQEDAISRAQDTNLDPGALSKVRAALASAAPR